MACKNLQAFNRLQISLIKESGMSAEQWINANSEDERRVYCTTLCPLRESCEIAKEIREQEDC
jgi:hypothetical protein